MDEAAQEAATARRYGRLFGSLSGLFAALQVMVSASAAKENASTIAGLEHAASGLASGIPISPFNLLADLVPVLLITYLSAAVAGMIMLGFAWFAGRTTAMALGRHAAGGTTGLWVALWSGAIWLTVSLVVTLVVHADGTLSGIFTSSPGTSMLGAEVILLLIQNGLAALIGVGLGALAGYIGARSARVPERFAPFKPFHDGQGIPPYGGQWMPPLPSPPPAPGFAGAPPWFPTSAPPVYPPPPEFYLGAHDSAPSESPS
jgi:hypothetical protein